MCLTVRKGWKMVGIYRITNLITGDCYIGKTKNFRKRIWNHKYKGVHSKLFESDIEAYGWDNFKAEMIEECAEKDLTEREAYYIEQEKPKYNTIVRGRKRSEETKKKISESLTGRKQSHETKAKRIASILKRHETIPQLNLGHRKKCASDEREFESVKEMANYYGVTSSSATHALKKGHKIKGHKVWYVV